jgi:glycosyltransferase involved in cell wall biosynthesis
VKTVLLAVPRMIVPALSGGELRVLSLVRALAPKYRFSVATFLEPGREAELAASALYLESQGVRAHLIPRGPAAPRSADAPGIARSYEDPEMARALRRIVAEEKADLVHLEFTQMAQYSESLQDLVPVVATEHDTSLLSGERSYLRPGQETAPEARRLAEAFLRRVLGACARVVTMSEADAERLAAIVPRERIRVVPTGVDLAAFPFRPLSGREPDRVAFVGHYAHFPNEDAAVFLCREVLPALLARRPGAKVSLIGSGVTPAVAALRSGIVEVTGPVPSVAPHLARARVFIAPMRLGFGIKGKLLEAFSSGLPSVATPEACEAMPGLRDGTHVLLARDAAGLADACARLLEDDALSERLARAARAYVEERFGWDRQAALLDAVYREALAARA